MPAATSIAIAGLASTAVSTGMSFAQASKQRRLQVEAQSAAKKAIAEAQKRLEVNYYDQLSIVKEPYELEREALLSSGAQAIEAARESQRGVAGTAGRVQMAQNVGQGQVRTAMGRDLMGLEAKSAAEDSRLRDSLNTISLAEVEGAQIAQAQAWEAQQRALQQGFRGVTSMVQQGAKLIPEDMKDINLPVATNKTMSGYDNAQIVAPNSQSNIQTPQGFDLPKFSDGKMLMPEFEGKSTEEIISILQQNGIKIDPNAGFDQLVQYIYS